MKPEETLFESSLPSLPLIGRGKVRDIYSVDNDHLLIVTTDRLSAYDVVMPDPVPMLTFVSRRRTAATGSCSVPGCSAFIRSGWAGTSH